VVGDYNTAHQAIDLARPKTNQKSSGFLPEERAEMIEQLLNKLVATWRGKNIHIRASIGCHYFSADANAKDVFDQADGKMYMRKRSATLIGIAPA
jgi:exodeoxyribonuclease-3